MPWAPGTFVGRKKRNWRRWTAGGDQFCLGVGVGAVCQWCDRGVVCHGGGVWCGGVVAWDCWSVFGLIFGWYCSRSIACVDLSVMIAQERASGDRIKDEVSRSCNQSSR